MIKTQYTYSIEALKVTNDSADVLVIENDGESTTEFPLFIVCHESGELDFYKGNEDDFEEVDLNFSDEVWDTIHNWVADNIPCPPDAE